MGALGYAEHGEIRADNQKEVNIVTTVKKEAVVQPTAKKNVQHTKSYLINSCLSSPKRQKRIAESKNSGGCGVKQWNLGANNG